MPFVFKKQEIPEVILIEPKIYGDDRGYFLEVYKAPDFKKAGIEGSLAQVNHSKSKRGVIRGLHFQKKNMPQAKIVSVVVGEIFDVAVDIRKGSPTYGKYVSATLSYKDKNMLYIPVGFAHGFCATSEVAEVIYYCDNIYAPQYEAGIIWNDPALSINWPVNNPTVSDKDQKLPALRKADIDHVYDGTI